METVSWTADGAARLKRGTQLARLRIAGDGVEVGDAVEHSAATDERVDLMPLRISSHGAARTGGAKRGDNRGADNANAARAQALHPVLEPGDNVRRSGAIRDVIDPLEPN